MLKQIINKLMENITNTINPIKTETIIPNITKSNSDRNSYNIIEPPQMNSMLYEKYINRLTAYV